MTKEQFIELMRSPEIPMRVWYEYYRERDGHIVAFAQFEYVFSVALWNEEVVLNSKKQPVKLSFQKAVDSLYNYHKNKFNMNEQSKPEEVKPDTREWPCEKCETGEYIHVSTIPGNMGSTMIYECNHCGDEKRFP